MLNDTSWKDDKASKWLNLLAF